MDIKIFWLLGFVLIGGTGAVLTFVRRFKNRDSEAGTAITGWTVALLIFWVIVGAYSFFGNKN